MPNQPVRNIQLKNGSKYPVGEAWREPVVAGQDMDFDFEFFSPDGSFITDYFDNANPADIADLIAPAYQAGEPTNVTFQGLGTVLVDASTATYFQGTLICTNKSYNDVLVAKSATFIFTCGLTLPVTDTARIDEYFIDDRATEILGYIAQAQAYIQSTGETSATIDFNGLGDVTVTPTSDTEANGVYVYDTVTYTFDVAVTGGDTVTLSNETVTDSETGGIETRLLATMDTDEDAVKLDLEMSMSGGGQPAESLPMSMAYKISDRVLSRDELLAASGTLLRERWSGDSRREFDSAGVSDMNWLIRTTFARGFPAELVFTHLHGDVASLGAAHSTIAYMLISCATAGTYTEEIEISEQGQTGTVTVNETVPEAGTYLAALDIRDGSEFGSFVAPGSWSGTVTAAQYHMDHRFDEMRGSTLCCVPPMLATTLMVSSDPVDLDDGYQNLVTQIERIIETGALGVFNFFFYNSFFDFWTLSIAASFVEVTDTTCTMQLKYNSITMSMIYDRVAHTLRFEMAGS